MSQQQVHSQGCKAWGLSFLFKCILSLRTQCRDASWKGDMALGLGTSMVGSRALGGRSLCLGLEQNAGCHSLLTEVGPVSASRCTQPSIQRMLNKCSLLL